MFARYIPFVALFLLAGCKGNSIEGKWLVTGAAAQPGTTTLTFNGGRVTAESDIDNPQAGKIKVIGTGTYTLAGEDLTINVNDVKVDTSGASAMAKAFASQPQFQSRLKSGMTTSQTAKVAFAAADRITLTAKGQTQTLVRAK